MKNVNDLELLTDIENRKPIKVSILDYDFGIYEWVEEYQRYEGFLAFTIKELLEILKTPYYGIKIERVR